MNGNGLLALLEKDHYITKSSRHAIELYMSRWQVSAFEALLSAELMSESALANALARSLKLDRIYHLRTFHLAEDTLDIMTFKRAREWECLALVGEDGKLDMVFADPTREDRINEIKQGLKRDFTLSVAERSDIVRAVDELYPLSAQLPSLYGER